MLQASTANVSGKMGPLTHFPTYSYMDKTCIYIYIYNFEMGMNLLTPFIKKINNYRIVTRALPLVYVVTSACDDETHYLRN